MNRKLKQFLTLILFTFSLFSNAQVYPVQVTPVLTPPYNLKLSSYATTTDVKLRVNILLRDVNEFNKQVRLKLIIKGQGLNIQSQQFVNGASPIYLNGGTNKILTNLDLSAYFQLNNLLGINPQQYNRPLPDGQYNFCFEVYDFFTNQKISNTGCFPVFLILNDPPQLYLPQRGEQIVYNPQMGINFSWTPRHANAGAVRYEFELREIWDNQIDPQAGFLASPPLYSETTRATTFLYNNTKPALLPDKTYAWRVRAISTTGISENSVFRNDGYSEIYNFRTTQNCDAPKFPLSEAKNPNTVKITWQGNIEHNKYHVQYRKVSYTQETDRQKERRERKNKKRAKKGQKEKDYVPKKEKFEWFEVYTQNQQAQIANLEAGQTYEFRVGGTCTSLTELKQYYTYTNTNEFTMPTEAETVNYNCGVLPDIQIANQDPIQNIGVNETFTAGDFPVTVKEIQGGNGVFSGTGFIVVPYLADTKIAVAFEGITINTNYQLIEGVVQTTYDPNWENVESIDEFVDGLIDAIEGLIDNIVDSIRDGNNADALVEIWQDLLDDPDSGLTDEQREALEELVKPENRDAIKEVVKATREAIESGAADEVIEEQLKKSLKSNLVPDSDSGDGNTVDPSDLLARIITALSNSGDIGAIKCKKCDESIEPLDGSYLITISGQNYTCIVAKLLSNGIELLSGNNIPDNASSNIATYYNLIKDEILEDDDVLYMFNQQGELTDCEVIYPLPEIFCNNPVPNSEIETQLTEEIEQCVDAVLNDIQQKLIALKQSFRSNQEAQFVRNGNNYKLNANDEVEVIENALTDTQIENGEWTDYSIDQIFRVYENENGILQFKAVGIRSNLPIFEGKTADLKVLSQNMKDKGNAFLNSFSVANINDTPQQKGATLDSDDFADGEQINIDEDANFFKIISEGAGKLGVLLKTAKIEESTYLNSTKSTEIIHAPPILTGSTEAAVRAVTDITGVVVLVYDISVDEEIRQQTWQGLKQVKDQIAENPSTLFPLLKDIIIEEATGNTPEDWAEINNEETDSGKKGHLTSKGVVRTTVTVFASGKLILKLPDMAAELSLKLLRGKLLKQLDNLGWDEALKDAFKADFDEAANIDFKNLFEQADEIRQVELFQSWKTIREAITNQSGTTQFALDTKTINKVADYFNSDKLTSIGGIEELKNFIAKHPDVPCSTCNGGGLPVFGTRTMDEMIENFVEVGHIFKDHPDLWQKLKIGTESANAAMREGTQHTLKVFKDNPTKYAPDKIADLDMKFESVLDDICVNCRFDVKFTNEALSNTIPKLAEFKSYNSNTWANIKNSPEFIRQFKRYLQDPEVSNLSNLQYIVNTSKAPLNDIKTAFKKMLTKEADNLFKHPSQGGLGIERVRQLFGNDIDFLDDLLDKVDDINNPIYDFIKSN